MDPAGNPQFRFEGGGFSIAMAPTVTSATPNLALVTDNNVGNGNFTVTVAYSEAMKTTVAPTLSLTPDVTAVPITLTFASGNWADNEHYVATYNVADANVNVPSVAIGVTGAHGADNDTQVAYSLGSAFGIDTFDPPPASALTDAVLSSGTLNPSISAVSEPTTQQSISPIDQALALTGTWLDI
jgi:hypothetical protein